MDATAVAANAETLYLHDCELLNCTAEVIADPTAENLSELFKAIGRASFHLERTCNLIASSEPIDALGASCPSVSVAIFRRARRVLFFCAAAVATSDESSKGFADLVNGVHFEESLFDGRSELLAAAIRQLLPTSDVANWKARAQAECSRPAAGAISSRITALTMIGLPTGDLVDMAELLPDEWATAASDIERIQLFEIADATEQSTPANDAGKGKRGRPSVEAQDEAIYQRVIDGGEGKDAVANSYGMTRGAVNKAIKRHKDRGK